MSIKNNVVGKYSTYPDKTTRRIAEGGLRIRGELKQSSPDEPLVTIITVCLNSGETIEQTIKSVTQQTYKNIEHIIIDGLSEDDTLDIIKKYEDFIDYYVSEPDGGLYEAINKGIELANGNYILILNSDDWYESDCVEALVSAKIYSGASFVSALARYVNQEGDHVHVLRHMPYDASLYFRMPLRHETMLISAEIYNDVGLYDRGYKIISDYDLTVRLFVAGYTLYEIQRPLINFRTSGVSNTNRSGLFKERMELIQTRFPFLKGNELECFSDLSKLTTTEVHNLAGRYSQEIDFIDSLYLYFKDRQSVDMKWKDDNFNYKSSAKTPFVSIILPVFNAEKTIRKCIDSVCLQTLKYFELVCVDDVSADQSKSIIEGYMSHESRIVLLANDKNIGLGASRNKGVKAAKGAYIFHVDPDDTIPPNALASLYSSAVKFNSDMIKGAYLREQLIHGERSPKAERKSLISGSETIINTSLKKTPKLLNTTEGHWSYLYKADFAKSVLYPTDLKMGQDSIFIVNALVKAETVTITDELVYYYCANPSSAMNTFSYRKYMDALEWRRRAWHVLNDAGMKVLGDRLLQSYWSDQFFKSLVISVTTDQLVCFFEKFRNSFKEASLLSSGPNSSPLISKLFINIIDGRDDEAEKLLRDVSNKKTLINEKDESLSHSPSEKKNVTAATAETYKPLKVLTLTTFDFGGAGTGTQRRVSALRDQGVDARIYALRVKSKHDYVTQFSSDAYTGLNQHDNLWQEISKRIILDANTLPKSTANEIFSLTDSFVNLSAIQDVINDSDIIHLHWVVGMLDYKYFDEIVKDKPIVWTLADMNAFTGGCHYSEGCDEYKNACIKCHLLSAGSNLAHEVLMTKDRLYRKLKNLHIICPSQWLADCASKSYLLRDIPVHVIPNPVQVNDFVITDKAIARIKLGLPLDRKLILFGADNLTNHRKGGDLLKEMVDELLARDSQLKADAVFFGYNKINLGINTHSFGMVHDAKHLSLIYSAVDVYVFPSREDNSPLTVGESLLSGTPVVSFSVGNVPDIVQHKKTGYIADYLSVTSLADGVMWALKEDFDSAYIKKSIDCRLSAVEVHDPILSARRHIDLYKSIIQTDAGNLVINNEQVSWRLFVLTPCLNVVDTIDETISSVVTQSGDFSITYIIQDGGSTDGTLDRLKYWDALLSNNNSIINCQSVDFSWVSESDSGMYDAICKGFNRLDIHDDEFMTWINGDDLLLPGAVASIMMVSRKYTDIEWIGSHTHNILENGEANVSRANPTPTVVIREGLCDGARKHWPHLQQEGTFFKKSLWDKGKNILDKFALAGDWALWCEFAKHAEYYQFEKPLGAFRIRKGQLSVGSRDVYEGELNNIAPMQKRNDAYRALYQIRRSLYANIIKFSSIDNDVLLDKETKFVRDYFYKKGEYPIYNQNTDGAENIVAPINNTKRKNIKKSSNPVTNKKTTSMKNVNANNFDYFTIALREHWLLFNDYCIELYGEALDLDQVDLKRYQDLLVYAFIKENIPKGSRIVEVGGGNSRLLKNLSDQYECWNIDKLDGVGNGPTSAYINNVHLIKDYMGSFNPEIPEDYFDFAFSVSVLEHVPQDDESLFDNIVTDINRVLKTGAYSLHLFDIVYKNGAPRVFSKFIPYIFDNSKTVNVFIDPLAAYKNPGIYYLSKSAYDNVWYKYTKKSYKDFGMPTSYNVLWENQ